MKGLWPLLFALFLVPGCTPDIGSEAWCEQMADKPAGDWTANEGVDYAKHCLLD